MAKELAAPVELLREVAKLGRLPVVMFSAGGIATPADAALMMKLGMDGVFVYVSLHFFPPQETRLTFFFSFFLFFSSPVHSGSGIFKSSNPELLAKAIVEATTHFNDPLKLADISSGLGAGMKGEGVLGKAAGKEMTADRGY
jgi:pyridoxal 5'-phosphate synthase pdxS subunit